MRVIKYLLLVLITLNLLNSLTGNNIFARYGTKEGGKYLAFAEQMPQPIGGIESIYKKVEYPEFARKAGVQGKVYVLAFIDENGNVEDVKIVKGIGAGCDEAAMDAVKSTKFVPGKVKGRAVKVKMSLQFKFKL